MIGQTLIKKCVFVAAAMAAILYGSTPASASYSPLQITFDLQTFTVSPGETGVEAFGTLTNISNDTVYLNSDIINLPGSTTNVTDYFGNTPISLNPGQNSGDMELFSFDVLSNATLGSAIGTYAIQGGNSSNPGGYDVVGSQNFTVNVQSPVPIPGTVLLFGPGLVGLIGLKRKYLG